MSEPKVTMMACGDIGPIHSSTPSLAADIAPVLAQADLRLAQCERVFSHRGVFQPHTGSKHARVDPSLARIFGDAGIDIASLASNHAMDWGWDALSDTIDVLQGMGLQTVGAGRDIAAAREPAVTTIRGVAVGVLAYCSVIPDHYAATADRPGVAPMRAHTYYRPAEWQPGMPPVTVTVPYEQDLAEMMSDIQRLRTQVDAVVVNLHWGLHFLPKVLADYQETVARAAFAAGADVIFGGHAHLPKGIAHYDGRCCFHSLSNFIMSTSPKTGQRARDFTRKYGTELDPAYPNLPYGADAKRSLIGIARFGRGVPPEVSFRPVEIDTNLRPQALGADDPRFEDAVDYLKWASEGLGTQFTQQADEVVLTAL